jgi:hypothetical protein
LFLSFFSFYFLLCLVFLPLSFLCLSFFLVSMVLSLCFRFLFTPVVFCPRFLFLLCVHFFLISFFLPSSFLYAFPPFILLVASQYHGRVFLLLHDLQQKLSMKVSGYTDYTHCRELMMSVGSCDRWVAIIHVTVDGSWECEETVTFVLTPCFYCFFVMVCSFCGFLFLWFWECLVGSLSLTSSKVLTLFWLLNYKYGDSLILMESY